MGLYELKNHYRRKYRYYLTQYFFRSQLKTMGRGCLIYKQNIFSGLKGISLGNYCTLLPNGRIELIFDYAREKFNPQLILGDYSQIHQNCHITCGNKIEIGKNVIITSNATITDIVHPYEEIDKPINQQKLLIKEVVIGDQTYIYNNAVILPGAKLGKHCVVAANSVVSGEFPDFCVIAGSPAKIIKQYNPSTGRWEKV